MASAAHRQSKTCARCGRTITWRRKWARNWSEIRYCSDACRARRRLTAIDERLETAILELLRSRARNGTICPSEAARRVAGSDEQTWRPLMEPTREAARRLAARGDLEFTQRGQPVDPSRARGPLRLRLLLAKS